MNDPANNSYTARQIALALGISKQAILRRLNGIPASMQLIYGKPVQAWPVSLLPDAMRKELKSIAAKRGYQNVDHLLAEAEKPWQCSIPLKDLAPECFEKATRLKRVLKPILERQADQTTTDHAMLIHQGAKDYAAEFGYSISERHLRNLIARALQRDANRRDFDRIELYLPDKLKRQPELQQVLISDEDFELLTDCLAGMKDPLKPSPDEKSLMWLRAFEWLESMIETGMPERKAKGNLLDFLHKRAFWLAESREALRVNFDRKRAKWLAGGRKIEMVLDQRVEKGGKPVAQPFKQEDLDKVAWHAGANCGGRIAQAVRELNQRGEFSTQMSDYLAGEKHSKSYVPQRLREAIKPDVFWIKIHHQGRKALGRVRPTMDCTYDGMYSLTQITGDNLTPPVIFSYPNAHGWFDMVQGQLLAVMDVRSAKILGFSIRPDRYYDSLNIWGLYYRVFDEFGLPENILREGSMWRNARLISGGVKVNKMLLQGLVLSPNEVEVGFRRFGITFTEAFSPQAKSVVEGAFRLLQNRMEGEPGYCGRNQRLDLPDRIKKQLAAVNARKAHPSNHFFNFEQWSERLIQIIRDYNSEPQEGKRLGGLSPNQAYEKFWNDADRPTKLGGNWRFLLATHLIPNLEVQSTGISFIEPRTKETVNYLLNDQATAFLERRVKAWYNPEIPERCTFTDMDGHNPFTLERQIKAPAYCRDQDQENQLKAGLEQINSSLKPGRIRYHILSQNFGQKYRQNLVGQEVIEIGEEIKAQQEKAKTAERKQQTLARVTRDLGIRLSPAAARRPETLEAASQLRRLLAEDDEPQKEQMKP